MSGAIYLDVSRLLLAAWSKTPSGIERVELAYAWELRCQEHTRFVAANLLGRMRFLPRRMVLAYLRRLEEHWGQGGGRARYRLLASAVGLNLVLWLPYRALSFLAGERGHHVPPVYLNVSHQNLNDRRGIGSFKARTGARMLFFIHDLIPVLYPEYARPGQAAVHRERLATVAELADAVIVNSAATRHELLQYMEDRPRRPPVYPIGLGIAHAAAAAAPMPAGAPYFLCLATIEPRKNHLLLLHLWRSLACTLSVMPRLIIVGRRGWENEMVLDLLERCPHLTGLVEERAGVADGELAALLQGATALLLPSFAEGYGLPVPEALAAGVPVICSDLPALREVGGDVPEYFDPLDGAVWRQAILDYAAPNSPRRAAQIARLAGWTAPSWEGHFARLHPIIAALAATA